MVTFMVTAHAGVSSPIRALGKESSVSEKCQGLSCPGLHPGLPVSGGARLQHFCSWDSPGQRDVRDRALRCLRDLHDTLDTVGTWC